MTLDQNNHTVSLVLDGPITINKKTFDKILLLVAPFERSQVNKNPDSILEKFSSAVDDETFEEMKENPKFVFCTMLSVQSVPKYEDIFKICSYTPTEDTVIAVRVFGLTGFNSEDGHPDYIEHVSCKVAFDGSDRAIFIGDGALNEQAPESAN